MKKNFRLNLLNEETGNQASESFDNLKINRLKKIFAAKVMGGGGIFTQFSSWGKGGIDVKVPISSGFSKLV